MCWVARYRSATDAVIVRLSRIAIHRASSSMIAKTRHSRKIAMRRTLVMMPLNDAPKSWLYSRDGLDSTAIRTLSRTPVSQSVTDSVEVKRTGRSATLTGGGSAPPPIHDLPDPTSSFEPAAPEFGAAGFGVAGRPPWGDGEVCPLPLTGVSAFVSLEVLPARCGNRLATPKPSATILRAEASTGTVDIRVKIRPSFNLC